MSAPLPPLKMTKPNDVAAPVTARSHVTRVPRAVLATLLALVLTAAPGCALVAVLADGIVGDEQRVKVEAEYRGLADHSVAVLVAADQHTLFYSPRARERVARHVSADIAAHVEGTTLVDPRQLEAFLNANAYWTTMRESRLLDELGVERLVVIDLVEYRTYEPGNRHIQRGQITGNIAVHAADSDDPDNPVHYRALSVAYPEDETIGVVDTDGDQETIELAMVKIFARDVARLFYDHEALR